MKHRIWFPMLFLIVVLFNSNCRAATAPEEFFVGLGIQSIKNTTDEPIEGHFGTAAIEENGDMVALAIKRASFDEIRIYNEVFDYQYSICLKRSQPYQLYIDSADKTLILYYGREDRYFKIDSQGQLLANGQGVPDCTGIQMNLNPIENGEMVKTEMQNGISYTCRNDYYLDSPDVTMDAFLVVSPEFGVKCQLVSHKPNNTGSLTVGDLIWGVVVIGGFYLFHRWKHHKQIE